MARGLDPYVAVQKRFRGFCHENFPVCNVCITSSIELSGTGVTRPPFTNDIRTLRFLAGEMTQEELGRRVGVTRQTIAAVEQGKYSPSLEVAFRIARVFGKPLETIFQWKEG